MEDPAMFTEDTDLTKVPWQLLIRARTVGEVDAVIASVVLNRIVEVGSTHVVQTVARAAADGLGANDEPATAEQKLGALSAVADFDEWYCGNGPRWPYPHRGVLDEVSDPVAVLVTRGARQLVEAGSPGLQKTLGEALGQIA
jgi:hypothetical protein